MEIHTSVTYIVLNITASFQYSCLAWPSRALPCSMIQLVSSFAHSIWLCVSERMLFSSTLVLEGGFEPAAPSIIYHSLGSC